MPAGDLSHHEGHSRQPRAISIQTGHTGCRGIFTAHSRWQRFPVRVSLSSETGGGPFQHFWVFNRTLKKLEVIFDNSLHFKTKQNKTSQHRVTVIRILIKKFFFVFAIHECLMKQSHQKVYIKLVFICLLEICAIDPVWEEQFLC